MVTHVRDIVNSLNSTQMTYTPPNGTANLDKHFELIHESHNELQQQLHRIETSTSQTNVDLEQLYSRLKNNNEHLNKLLKNIVEYSNEVITEGNATKSDMSLIIKELDDLKRRNISLGDDDIGRIRDVMRLIFEEKEGSNGDLKGELEDLAKSLKDDRLSKQILQEQFDHLSESIKELDTSVHLEKIDKLIKMNKEWKEDLRRELQPVDKLTEIESANSQIVAKLSAIEQYLQEQRNKETASQLISTQDSRVAELEKKIQALETNYESLVEKYTQKYDQYKLLLQQFKELSEKSQTQYVPDLSRMQNLKRFHKDNLKLIDENSFTQNSKRIVSTPVGFVNNSDED